MKQRLIMGIVLVVIILGVIIAPFGDGGSLVHRLASMIGQGNVLHSFEGAVWVTVGFVVLLLVLCLLYAAYWKKRD